MHRILPILEVQTQCRMNYVIQLSLQVYLRRVNLYIFFLLAALVSRLHLTAVHRLVVTLNMDSEGPSYKFILQQLFVSPLLCLCRQVGAQLYITSASASASASARRVDSLHA